MLPTLACTRAGVDHGSTGNSGDSFISAQSQYPTSPVVALCRWSAAALRVMQPAFLPPPAVGAFYIRDFEPADTAAVHAVSVAGHEENGSVMEIAIQQALQDDLADIEQQYVRAPRSAFFCAVDSATQELLGTVGVRPLKVGDREYYEQCRAALASSPTPSAVLPFAPDTTAELNRMTVSPHARRRGVARALMQRLLAFCRAQKYTHVHLTTLASMRKAVALYTSCGLRRYRADRLITDDDGKFSMEDVKRTYAQKEQKEQNELKYGVAEDDKPTEEAAIADMRDKGVRLIWHFAMAIDGSAEEGEGDQCG